MKTLTLPSPFERERRPDTRLVHDKFSCPCIWDTMATYRISRSLSRLSPWVRGEDKGEGLCRNRSALTLTPPSPFNKGEATRRTHEFRRSFRKIFRLSPWARGEDKGEGLGRDRSVPTLTLPSPFKRERRSDTRLVAAELLQIKLLDHIIIGAPTGHAPLHMHMMSFRIENSTAF